MFGKLEARGCDQFRRILVEFNALKIPLASECKGKGT